MKTAILPRRRSGQAWAGRSIGLFGGSFNPPHEGHLHASLLALRTLGLDQVWWLVSPQNPLKPAKGMAPFAERLAQCRAFVRHPRILVTGIEAELHTRYTADTLRKLKKLYPRTRFVWIMGADNLIQVRHWNEWRSIFATVPVAIYDRPPYSLKAKTSFAARYYRQCRRLGTEARSLGRAKLPAWTFFHTKLNAMSSTAIRRKQQEEFSHIDHR